MEFQHAGHCSQVPLELHFLPKHVERALVVERAEGVELFHHEALDGELLDDGFLDASLGGHAVDIEMDAKLVFVLQVADVAVCPNGEPSVVGSDLDVAEGHAVVVAVEPHAEVQRHGEVFEDGGKGPRDVLQLCAARDGRRAVGQCAALLLAGQHDVALGEPQLGIDLADDKVAEEEALLVPREGGVQVADVDAHDGVTGGALGQLSLYDAVLCVVDFCFQVGIDIEVLEVEETAFGLAGILAGMVVVVSEMEVVDVDEPALLLVMHEEFADGGIVGHEPSFLVDAVPLCRQLFDADLGLVAAFLSVEQLVEGERIVVVADMDVLDNEPVHDERQRTPLLLPQGGVTRASPWGGLVGVFLEGIDDELVVGDGVDGVVVQLGAQAHNFCLVDAHLMVEQCPGVHVGLQIVHL